MSYATDFEQAIDDKAYVKAFELAFAVQNGADMDQAMHALSSVWPDGSGSLPGVFKKVYGGTPTDISG
jgi:hypothetical protein